MYARVTRWEDAEAEALRAAAEGINSEADSGPPEGVPAKSFGMLIDPDAGRALGIAMFETDEDMGQGDAALNAMDPPGGPMGRRASVEMYEVAVDVTAP